MENKGKIVGVSLGPGEPELITLKALNTLKEADVIFCPGTMGKDEAFKSRALDILSALPVDISKVRTFHVPMSRNREEAMKAYDAVSEQMIGLAMLGKNMAVTAEGDSCFYSSANYMYEKLRTAGFSVEMIAGVPAFIAAGASIGLHVVKQQERLLVIPGDVIVEELLEVVVAKRSVVIMKVPLGESVLRPFIARHPELHYHYFENVGTAEEFYTSQREEILERSFTYFSMLFILPG